MHFPSEWYQMHQTIARHFPHLRPAQQRGLTLWVYGTILAHSACQNAVITALVGVGSGTVCASTSESGFTAVQTRQGKSL